MGLIIGFDMDSAWSAAPESREAPTKTRAAERARVEEKGVMTNEEWGRVWCAVGGVNQPS